MHDRISIHSICFGDAGIEELGRNWRALGARRVSFSSDQLLSSDPKAVRAMIDAADQRAETIAHVFFEGVVKGPDDNLEPDRTRLMRTIDAAAMIGARSIYMVTGARGKNTWQEAATLFSQGIAPCVTYAKQAGVALAVENTTPLDAGIHIGNNLLDALSVAEQAGMGLCVDIFSCWTEATLYTTFKRAMPLCRIFQVSDYVYGDRGLPCRAVPGDGSIPLKAAISEAMAAGYEGSFDLEMMGPRIMAEGQLPAVRRAAAHIGAILEELGV